MHINIEWLSKVLANSHIIRSVSMNLIAMILLLVVGCVGHDPVDTEFNWVPKEMLIKGKTVKSLFAWYKVVELSKMEKHRLITTNLEDRHYGNWMTYKSILSFPDGYSINGFCDNIVRAAKMGSDEHDGIFLFVNLDNNQLIMVYGKTYGR